MFPNSVLLIVVLVLASHLSGGVSAWDVRLRNDTSEPLHYDVTLTMDIEAKQFFAEEFILINVISDTVAISINSHKLNVNWLTSCRLISELDQRELVPSSVNVDTEGQIFHLVFDEIIPANTRHTLHIKDVTGDFGFGLIEDVAPESFGYLLTTGFNNTNLRAVFPCYDQPSFRTTFKFTVYHPEGYALVAGGYAITQDGPSADTKNMIRSVFEIKKPFSTPSIGFMLTNQTMSATSDNRIRVYHEDPQVREILAVNFYNLLLAVEREFKLEGEVPKLEIVFMPTMTRITNSRWGLVVFNPDLIPILNNSQMEAIHLRDIQNEIAMVIYSQFFGHLVNIEWWADEWVICGLARYMSGVSKHLPFDAASEFVGDVVQKVIREYDYHYGFLANWILMDGINDPQTLIRDLRAGSVMRTLALNLGQDTFQSAAIDFLKAQLYTCVFASDFETHLDSYELITKLPDDMLLSALARNYGNEGPIRNYLTTKWNEEEARLEIGDIYSKVQIPVDYMTPSIPAAGAPKHWITKEKIVIENFSEPWIVLDPHQMALSVVNYGDQYWPVLAKELQKDHEAMFYRKQLIEDSYTSMNERHLHVRHHLNLIEYLPKEKDARVWRAARISYEAMAMTMRGYKGNMTLFNNYYIDLVNDIYMANRIGDEKADFEITREVAKIACGAGHRLCVFDVQEYAKEALEKQEYVRGSSDFQQFVYCTLAKADEKEVVARHVVKLWAKDRRVNAPARNAIRGLACTEDREVIARFLNYAINKRLNEELDMEITREERAFFLVAFLRGSHIAVKDALRFIMLNYDAISELMSEHMEDVFVHMCWYIRSEEQRWLLQDIYKIHEKRMPSRVYNAMWDEASNGWRYSLNAVRRHEDFDEWLAERGSGVMATAAKGILLIVVAVVVTMLVN